MRDEDKPFVCYKRGWNIKIVPRGGAGWRAFGAWMAAFGIMLAGFLAIMATLGDSSIGIAVTAVLVVISIVWAVVMIRWMMARSEMVDLDEMLDLKRRNEGSRPKGRRP